MWGKNTEKYEENSESVSWIPWANNNMIPSGKAKHVDPENHNF